MAWLTAMMISVMAGSFAPLNDSNIFWNFGMKNTIRKISTPVASTSSTSG